METEKSVLVLSSRADLVPRAQHITGVMDEMGLKMDVLSPQNTLLRSLEQPHSLRPLTTLEAVNILLKSVMFFLLLVEYIIRGYNKNPDIIYCPHIGLLPAAGLLSLISRSILVYDVIEKYAEEYWSSKTLTKAILSIESTFLPFVDIIFVIDSKDDVILKRYKNRAPIVETIYNVPQKKKLKKHKQSSSLIYVGNLEEVKGVKKLIPAFAKVMDSYPKAEMTIIGPSFDSIREEMIATAEKKGIRQSVTFIDKIPYDEVHGHLLEADIGLAPYQNVRMNRISRFNSRKIFDYMNAGLPIIGPNFGGIGEAIEQLECGLTVNTGNKTELADGMRQLLSDPDEAQRLGNNGRQLIVEKYNWKTEKEKVKTAVSNSL
ncbi:glycosyltransferase [Halorubrum sp. SD683]|uniref:glycosyltransferase n=1 Tax=Halorubrum sp. SD683 TaxID=1855873 RepID=UPI000A2D8883|nr:glycosyltransferase [Halorubrum sp. SD683]OTF01234.1 hypothetical protein B9G49_04035 [Halorubrum sp. SD683]